MKQSIRKNIVDITKSIPLGQSLEQLKQFWDEFAPTYNNNLDANISPINLTILNMLKIHKANKILETACGTGYLLPQIIFSKQSQAQYYATDLSTQMLAQLHFKIQLIQHKFNNENNIKTVNQILKPQQFKDPQFIEQFNLHIQQINSEKMDFFKDNYFDVYLSNHSLMLTENPINTIKEAYRVLNKGGQFCFSVWGDKEKSVHFTIFPKVLKKNGIILPAGRSNFILNDKQQLIKLFSQVGFTNLIAWNQFTPFSILNEEDIDLMLKTPFNKNIISQLPEDKQKKVKSDLIKEFHKYIKDKQEPIGLDSLLILGSK